MVEAHQESLVHKRAMRFCSILEVLSWVVSQGTFLAALVIAVVLGDIDPFSAPSLGLFYGVLIGHIIGFVLFSASVLAARGTVSRISVLVLGSYWSLILICLAAWVAAIETGVDLNAWKSFAAGGLAVLGLAGFVQLLVSRLMK